MKVHFEEKTYESYFNNELDSKSLIYFPPGQVLEGLLGFDAASYSQNRELWRMIGFPWFYLHFSGVNLRDIADELEDHLDDIVENIPTIKTNLLFQYKRPTYITTANGKEWSYWGKEYYRYKIYREQHELLSQIETSFGDKALVLYASPAISSMSELVKIKIERKIIENSNFTKSSQLNNHSVNTYTKSGNHSIAFSEPEKIENLNLLTTLESFESRHDLDNKSFLLRTTNIISENMHHSVPFQKLMEEYQEVREYDLVYSLITMKVFREITGIQWLLSI